MTRVAALPMYDLPELRPRTDALWAAVAEALRRSGVAGVPDRLERDLSAEAIWRHPELLLSQTCGYPLTTSLPRVRVIATPTYRAPGCGPGTYTSAVVVRAGAFTDLDGLRGKRVAVNALDSHSGMNALRASVAPLAQDGRFFSELSVTGSHRASLSALREARADVAAIDAVTLALLRDVAPGELEGLHVLTWTDAAPCLPMITGAATSAEDRGLLAQALAGVADDPRHADTLRALRLEGFVPAQRGDYRRIAELEAQALGYGYAALG